MACRICHPTICRFWHATLDTLAYTRSLYEDADCLSYLASYYLSVLACYSRIYEDFICKRRRLVDFGILLAYACGILVRVYVQ
nr:TPA: hypothetical protein [Oryctes rhinoceros nudivirus]